VCQVIAKFLLNVGWFFSDSSRLFWAILFHDKELGRKKYSMAKFCKVLLRADGAKGLSNCVSV